jgi:hypothetical protein
VEVGVVVGVVGGGTGRRHGHRSTGRDGPHRQGHTKLAVLASRVPSPAPPISSSTRATSARRPVGLDHFRLHTNLTFGPTVESHCLRVLFIILGRRGSENQYFVPNAD